MGTVKTYLKQLCFFVKGLELHVFLLISLAIFIGLIEAFNLSLLYPMLSVGFEINTNSLPFYYVFETLGTILPIGSPFVNLGVIFIALTFLSLLMQLLYWKIGLKFQTQVMMTAKTNIFRKIKSNDFQFFVDNRQGELLNLFTQSPGYINNTFLSLINLCADLIASMAIICMLFMISPGGLTLVMIGGIIFYGVLYIIGKNISEKLGRLQIQSGEDENTVVNEYISGVKSIIAANASSFWEKNYSKALKIYWNMFAEYMFIQRIPIVTINSFFYIAIGLVVLVLYVFHSSNFITLIPIVGTFAAATMKILPKFTNIGEYKLQLSSTAPHLKKVYYLIHDNEYRTLVNGTENLCSLQSEIRFDKVSFAYHTREIVQNISFTIEKGKVTALVGPSGSGKSTITNLILRLYDINSGKITFDGHDIRQYDIASIRDIIGYVNQEPFVYNASIRDNITFGKDYSDEEVIWAANLAQAHEFISRLPEGYNTVIGDRGLKLSGGEKQRLVIARSMIRRPEILILDEATSSLDNISEATVQLAIDRISNECTTLIIAHRSLDYPECG